jgi:divalent metal cation (Fe/Co/Zn/Cd) transporter
MTAFTPSIPYEPGQVVLTPPDPPTGFTRAERLAVAFAGLLVAAVMAFGLIHVAPNRHLFPQNEVVGTLGLYWSSILLLAGVLRHLAQVVAVQVQQVEGIEQ